jgi:LmbE family N-acetylglucosaminyl deacetylase
MKFSNPSYDCFVPSGINAEVALKRTTHLCVAAHQDDIEIMAYSGISECYDQDNKHFTGVVVTNGAGSPRGGPFANMTDLQMQDVRKQEQRRAAELGKYNLQIQLSHPSADVKMPHHPGVASDLEGIFRGCSADFVYLHNPADKHETHIAVLLRCITAIQTLPLHLRPKKVYGCEVWRDLDWLPDNVKVGLDTSQRPELALALLEVFESQIKGGKRYDLATLGRRLANATFYTSHETDTVTSKIWAVDLTPLFIDKPLALNDLISSYIYLLAQDVSDRISRLS